MGENENGPTVLTLVIDAVGITTLEYLLDNYNGKIDLPNLSRMGLGNLLRPQHYKRVRPDWNADFAYAISQSSASADSVMGHRELVGVIDPNEYELFFNGFPADYIAKLEERIGRKTIFNKMAGGIEAIKLNKEEHERTGHPIVYPSKCDPLIQIAMNELIIPVPEAHRIADIAFDLAMETGVRITRSIARTYIMQDGEVVRTANRHDKVLPLSGPTLIDVLHDNRVYTVSVGKPAELINTNAWDQKTKLTNKKDLDPALGLRFVNEKGKDTNPYSFQGAVNELRRAKTEQRPDGTFIFVNLVDTDSLYGHTQDVEGTLKSVQETDRCLPLLLREMVLGDILIITADHGMEHRRDYGYHSKEPVPFLATRIGGGMQYFRVGTTDTFAVAGDVIAQAFCLRNEYLKACNLENVLRLKE